jgi:putative transposase
VDELACFSEVSRQRAFERFELLRAHLEDGRPLTAIAREARLSYRTLQYWLERYRTYGLVGLVHKPRTDRGRRRKLSAALQEVIEGLALQKPPLPIRVVCNRARLAAERLGEEAPGYDLVHDVVSHLPTDLVTLAHQGAKAYSNSFELVYRREAGCPNAIWQADHTPLDIELVQLELDSTSTAKPWLTAIVDDYSRAVAGYFLSFESPSSLNTALALRQAIWRKEDPRWKVCGIPEVLYTDNGSDFTSRHLEQVSADLKIRLVFSTPGVPRGRGRIERFFSSIDQMFLCTLPGFKFSGGKKRLTLAEFDVLFRKFIVETYHERPHGETGMPPLQRWEQGGFLPRNARGA